MYTYVDICTPLCMCACVLVCVCIGICMCTCICTCRSMCMCLRMCTCICICLCICTCIYVLLIQSLFFGVFMGPPDFMETPNCLACLPIKVLYRAFMDFRTRTYKKEGYRLRYGILPHANTVSTTSRRPYRIPDQKCHQEGSL